MACRKYSKFKNVLKADLENQTFYHSIQVIIFAWIKCWLFKNHFLWLSFRPNHDSLYDNTKSSKFLPKSSWYESGMFFQTLVYGVYTQLRLRFTIKLSPNLCISSMKGQLWSQYMLTDCWQLHRYKTGTLNFMKFCKVNLELSHLLSLEVLKKLRSSKKTFILICKGCVRYLNRCTTSPMYIYQLKVNKKMSLQSLTISSLTTHCILYINHVVFMNLQWKNWGKPAFKLCDILECQNKSLFKNQNIYLGEIDNQVKN